MVKVVASLPEAPAVILAEPHSFGRATPEARPCQGCPVQVGTSGDLKVVQTAFAIGFPARLSYTLTAGVVSGLNRAIPSPGGTLTGGAIQVRRPTQRAPSRALLARRADGAGIMRRERGTAAAGTAGLRPTGRRRANHAPRAAGQRRPPDRPVDGHLHAEEAGARRPARPAGTRCTCQCWRCRVPSTAPWCPPQVIDK
jgi:hypothetical protein